MPYANVKSGVMDINDSDVRDQVNQLLAGVTARKFVTPYIAMERVAKTLANFHIYVPNQGILEGDSGSVVWPINQFGGKLGMTNDAEVVVAPSSQYSVFFEYRMSDCGMFMVFCEVVDQDELEEIMNDLEAELNGESEDEEELDEGYVSYRVVKKSDGKSTYDKFGDTKSGTVTIGDKKRAAKDNESDKKEDSKRTSAAEKKARFEEESGYYYGKQPVSELKMSDEQQMDEVSKGTLASYIKKASHDVATKSAQVRGHAMKSKEAVDKQDITTARKEDERSNKAFKKSWKRREGIAKAADKLAKEETQLDEISDKLKARYVKKAEKDKAHAERQAAHSEYTASHAQPERKAAWKKEAEWLKGIAAKRAKGIERAKK